MAEQQTLASIVLYRTEEADEKGRVLRAAARKPCPTQPLDAVDWRSAGRVGRVGITDGKSSGAS